MIVICIRGKHDQVSFCLQNLQVDTCKQFHWDRHVRKHFVHPFSWPPIQILLHCVTFFLTVAVLTIRLYVSRKPTHASWLFPWTTKQALCLFKVPFAFSLVLYIHFFPTKHIRSFRNKIPCICFRTITYLFSHCIISQWSDRWRCQCRKCCSGSIEMKMSLYITKWKRFS